MKILVIDTYGESVLDWCLRCQEDGHQVRWAFAETPRNATVGKGLVQIVRDWREWIRWADLVFMTDNTKYLRELDAWRKRGIKIVGPSEEAASWEIDRAEGMKVLERAGIETPPCVEFKDYDKAIAYVKREGRRFVSKPNGVEGDKSLSYVAKDAADMVYMLERWKKAGKLKGSFVLQEFIAGCEFGVGGWFGPGGWNEGWEHNVEHKKLMPGELGPNTGEMGTAVWFVKRSKLASRMLKPLTSALERIGYVGCIDVNVIVDETGKAWPLEFTMRPGWPSFNIQQALMKGDHAEWLYDLAEGRDARAFVMDTMAIGVVMGLPDMPYDHRPVAECLGIPIYGVTDAIAPHVHPCMVGMGEVPVEVGGKVVTMPQWVSAGTYLLVVTGTGESVRAARKQAYRVLKRISVPGSAFYRDDIGEKLRGSLPKLQEHGYAEGAVY